MNGERLPLSFGQEQLWFLDQLAPGRSTYNTAANHRLTGELRPDLLRTALSEIVRRHESLRCTVHVDDGAPYLLAAPPSEVDLEVIDLSGLDPGTREAKANELLAERVDTPFDLTAGPLYRYTLIRLAPEEHILSQRFHHIITDGWSNGLMNAELATIYAALAKGEDPALEPPSLRYADFAARQRDLQTSGELEAQLEYWEQRLAGLPALDLPADRSRPAEQSFVGGSLSVTLSGEVLPAARNLVKERGISMFMLLSAATAALLTRYTGQEDIPIGIATLGRTDPDFEELVGFFTNMVVLRADTSGDPVFGELLDQVADHVMDAYDNQDAPFELVVDRVQPTRDLGRNPLFVVGLQLIDGRLSATDFDLPDLRAEPVGLANPVSRFDLAMNFVELSDRLELVIEYSADLFDRWRIEALAAHLEHLLAGACADPDRPLSQLPLLAGPERAELLDAGRGEFLDYGPEPVHAVVAAKAAEQPDHPAAVYLGEVLTYGELDRRAEALARYLRDGRIHPGQIVAVAMERDLNALVTFLGVLKAGVAYVALDPANPPNRLDYMLRDTATPLVLTQSRVRERIPGSGPWQVVEVDGAWAEIAAVERQPMPEWADRDSLAYVLYTSGSTGRPKGVLIEHRALMSFAESYRRVFGLVPEDRMLQLAALSFDMSHGEIFAGLCAGSTIVLVDQEAGSAPDVLAQLMRDQRTTYACMSPAMLSLVEAGPYPDLRKIMMGAEAIPAELVNKWNTDGRRLINVYGPTEAAVGCTAYECPPGHCEAAPPIGAPFPDRRMYIVDKYGELVPRGVPGELLIGGPEGLARGYLNQPELTAAAFTEDPFHPGGRVYRTGDLVRWNHDLRLEFVGRVDNQVKLHGLRIELEEIEAALLASPEVGTAAVALRPDRRGSPRLVGYVTPADGREPAPAELKVHLLDRLPEYMVPTAWVVLERMPLTAARKVDRGALPDPEPDAAEEFLAPQTPTEQTVAEVFTEVLGEQRIGAASSFFENGGNSLEALRLVSRLNRAFGIKFKLRRLFGNPTVRGIAAVIDEQLARRAPAKVAADGA
ncbi:non-ribosomal peptide synthetase [Amycolatopsis sp. YIM 10]|uniref:non-ribosomal peptide synthetase n=1 Tax=Amycolatopsis sp. YIM 10 TaxID=2653857 RepID=UPI0012901BC6|nr:non-ribosomal peptide synthetase [Amycolatopsis sp. YIM 10]QFU89283.1 Linear gramicidin synthase subunit D [Amycolatopsis sp. YIM 10]